MKCKFFSFGFSLEENFPRISGFIYNFKDLEMLHKVSSALMTFFSLFLFSVSFSILTCLVSLIIFIILCILHLACAFS